MTNLIQKCKAEVSLWCIRENSTESSPQNRGLWDVASVPVLSPTFHTTSSIPKYLPLHAGFDFIWINNPFFIWIGAASNPGQGWQKGKCYCWIARATELPTSCLQRSSRAPSNDLSNLNNSFVWHYKMGTQLGRLKGMNSGGHFLSPSVQAFSRITIPYFQDFIISYCTRKHIISGRIGFMLKRKIIKARDVSRDL